MNKWLTLLLGREKDKASLQQEESNLTLKLNRVLKQLRMTPSQVAEHLGHESEENCIKWFKGDSVPTFAFLSELSNAFNIREQWLKHENNEPYMYQVYTLPDKCIYDFYAFAEYIFNFDDEDITNIKLIRNRATDEVLFELSYGEHRQIVINCHSLVLNECIYEMGYGHSESLRSLILFLALFQKNRIYLPDTYTIDDGYFKSIQVGACTFKKTRYSPKDANDFIASQGWSHRLYDFDACVNADEPYFEKVRESVLVVHSLYINLDEQTKLIHDILKLIDMPYSYKRFKNKVLSTFEHFSKYADKGLTAHEYLECINQHHQN